MLTMGNTELAGPLDGVKVLDFSVMISGPLAAMMLADQGADVIKVESPGLGDIMRFLGTNKGGMTGIFANNNRGKRSIVVDLKQPAGADLVRRLAEDADVVIQNFRPGAMDRLGLGYDDLRAVNPDLIYTSISGLRPGRPVQRPTRVRQRDPGRVGSRQRAGRSRRRVSRRSTARSSATRPRPTPRPRRSPLRCSLGRPDEPAASTSNSPCSTRRSPSCGPTPRWTPRCSTTTPMRSPTIAANYSMTRLADGFAAASPVTDSEFRGLCAALGRPEIADDPRFADVMSRMANTTAMVELLVDAAAACTVEDFAARAVEHDVPASTVTSLARDPRRPAGHPQRGLRRTRSPAGRTVQGASRRRPPLGDTAAGQRSRSRRSASTPMRSCSNSVSTPSPCANRPRSSDGRSRPSMSEATTDGHALNARRDRRPQPATKPPAASARSTMPASRTVSLGFSPLTVTAHVTLSARSNTMACVLSTVPVCPTAPPP